MCAVCYVISNASAGTPRVFFIDLPGVPTKVLIYSKNSRYKKKVIKTIFEIVIRVTESSQKLTLQGVVELISLASKPPVSY